MPDTDLISAVSSAIAAALIRKTLDEGGEIEIPSLGITLKKEEALMTTDDRAPRISPCPACGSDGCRHSTTEFIFCRNKECPIHGTPITLVWWNRFSSCGAALPALLAENERLREALNDRAALAITGHAFALEEFKELREAAQAVLADCAAVGIEPFAAARLRAAMEGTE